MSDCQIAVKTWPSDIDCQMGGQIEAEKARRIDRMTDGMSGVRENQPMENGGLR